MREGEPPNHCAAQIDLKTTTKKSLFTTTENFLAEVNLYSCDHAVIMICHSLIFTFFD